MCIKYIPNICTLSIILKKGSQRAIFYLLTTELEIAVLLKDAPTALEDGALFKEASPSLWEQHVVSCLTLLLLILADASLAEENLDKQVVPGCSCALFCFVDE